MQCDQVFCRSPVKFTEFFSPALYGRYNSNTTSNPNVPPCYCEKAAFLFCRTIYCTHYPPVHHRTLLDAADISTTKTLPQHFISLRISRSNLGSPEKYRSHHVRREETQCSFTSFCNVEKTLFLLCLFGQVGNNISMLFCFSVPPFPVYVMSDAFSFRTRRNNYRSSCEKTQSSCAPYLTRSCTRRSISSVGKFWAFRWKTKS